mgnify:CR=1 FL=1
MHFLNSSNFDFKNQEKQELAMTTITSNKTNELWYAKTGSPTDKTSQTDDQRIKDINVLPPPEHLIRFFPIHGSAAESLIS